MVETMPLLMPSNSKGKHIGGETWDAMNRCAYLRK